LGQGRLRLYETQNHHCGHTDRSRHRGARLLWHHLQDKRRACRYRPVARRDYEEPLYSPGRRSGLAGRRHRVARTGHQEGMM
jgi:hypothetical protein